MRRIVLTLLFLLASPLIADEPALSRIGFGSGLSPDRPQPIWNAILEARPEVFLFLGDSVFLDTDMPDIMRTKYAQLGNSSGLQELRGSCAVFATWSGHDYGMPTAGASFREKAASSKFFRDFWELKGTPNDGIYMARTIGPSGKRVQMILLDTRSFRVASKKQNDGSNSPATLLGDAQWKWLNDQLGQQAEIRLICTPLPVNNNSPGESWADFPDDRQKLEKTLKDTKANGVVFLSGDRTGAELTVLDMPLGYSVFELTANGLNMGSKQWKAPAANPKRVGVLAHGDNFGMIVIDWARTDPEIRLQGRDITGDVVFQDKVELSLLRPAGSVPPPSTRPTTTVAATPTTPAAPLVGGAVTPDVAVKKIGEKMTVQFRVVKAGQSRDGGRKFLNSSDARDASNLTIMIDMKKAGELFQKAGIADPGKHFEGKIIRVTGTVTTFRDLPQIAVEDPSQIEIVGK